MSVSISAANRTDRSIDCKTAWVIVAAVSLLALSISGVRVARASDDIAAGGQTCEAPAIDVASRVETLIERAVEARSTRGGVPVVALNNQGYNYRSGTEARPSQGAR